MKPPGKKHLDVVTRQISDIDASIEHRRRRMGNDPNFIKKRTTLSVYCFGVSDTFLFCFGVMSEQHIRDINLVPYRVNVMPYYPLALVSDEASKQTLVCLRNGS